MSKWNSTFFSDLGERVGATFLGAILGLVTLSATEAVAWTDWSYLWPIVGVPTLVSLIKGVLANMAAPDSGASAIPPGPRVEGGYAVLGALGLGLVVLTVLLLVLTLLGAASFSWVVLAVLFVIGLVLIWIDRGTGGRVV